ncbi:MAG: hypothetical protein IKX31_11795 [Muribaculaceae bacterium]|nr:hypothetical protein [Muribaculaceae bacterium]
MKKFIVLSVIAVATLQAWACGGWVRPNYYMFSVFNRDLMDDPFAQETKQYWVNYTGDESAEYACETLGYVKPEEFDKSENLIIKTARKKGDKETLNYLRLLTEYLNHDGSDYTSWEYPSKEKIAQDKAAVEKVKTQAAAYKGKKYKSQYALLQMRCNMTAGNHKDNIAYWENTASKLPNSVYKNWMKDIYAGALYNTGEKDKASEIYAELGDMASIKYCVRKKRNLNGIKEEYAANPNSQTLIFLVQDFVNNTQETLDNGSDPEVMKYVEATGIYQKDMEGFIEFAGQVLAEGKTKYPAMWEAARGFVNYMAGNQNDAITQLKNAQNLEGTQRMKDNARACLLLASIKSAQPTNDYYNYLLGEYKWLESKAGFNATSEKDKDYHYSDVFERVTYDNLVPQLQDWGEPYLAMALLGVGNSLDVPSGSTYLTMLDDISSSELEAFDEYIRNGDHNAFEKWAVNECSFNADNFNDLMGTKLVREGEFRGAINYLEKVPTSYISEQGISYYMARKDYNQEIWLKRQFLSFLKEELTPVKSNAKLDFCRDMIALDAQIEQATGEDKNELLYRKANLLYQASHKGDCWYLAHYSNGVYSEPAKSEFDFIGTTRRLLRTVERNTSNLELMQKCVFAQTFITGETTGYCVQGDYDWNSKTWNYYLNPDVPHYRSMTRLVDFNSEHPDLTPDYITKCDILKHFMALK